MGGRTGASRNAHMGDLLARYIKVASRSTGMPRLANAPIPTPRPDVTVITHSVPEVRRVRTVSITNKPAPLAHEDATQPLENNIIARSHALVAGTPELNRIDPEQGSAEVPVAREEERPQIPAGTWVVQIGAYEQESQARDALARVRSGSDWLAKAAPFTEPVEANGTTLYRARFAGFDKNAARQTCAWLKSRQIGCFIAQN